MKEATSEKNNESSSFAVPLALFVTTSVVYYHRLLLRDYQRLLRLQQQQRQDDHDNSEHGSNNNNKNTNTEDDEHFETLYKFRRCRDRLSFDAQERKTNHHHDQDDNQKERDECRSKMLGPIQKEMDHIGKAIRRSYKNSFWIDDALPRFSRACSMDYHYSSRSNWSHFEEFAEDSIKIENQGSIVSKDLKMSATIGGDKDLCGSDDDDNDDDTTNENTVKKIAVHTESKTGAEKAELLIQKVMKQKENESNVRKASSELSSRTARTQNLSSTNKDSDAAKNEEKKENGWVNTFFTRISSSLISNDEDSNDDNDDDEETSSNDEMNESYAGDECDAISSSSPQPRSSFSTITTTTTIPRHSLRSSTSMPIDNKKMESARTDYNARIMPSKVVMVRHGQSEGNVSENLYATKPDNAMQLTKLGWDQAKMAGKALRERVLRDGESVHFIVSPYVRTLETFHGIISAWCDPSEFDHIEDHDLRMKAWYERLLQLGLTWHEDPRIREQDFGNYQDPATIKKCKSERNNFGAFYYRFPHGESASDVFDRVSTFLDSLWRSFDLQRSRNYVLITHGISIRVLLSRYFRYSIDQFSMLANPKNCEMVILGHDGMGKLRLDGRCQLELKSSDNKDSESDDRDSCGGRDSSKMEVVGYKFHERLRVLPKKFILKRCIRMNHDDTVCTAAFSTHNTS